MLFFSKKYFMNLTSQRAGFAEVFNVTCLEDFGFAQYKRVMENFIGQY